MRTNLLHFVAAMFLILAPFCLHAQNEYTSNCNDPAGGCDTVGIEHRISPWRIGLFAGPAVAYCGTWENTFKSDKFRDKSLFNGVGFNAAFNADYYFNRSKPSLVKFGLGAMAGFQNFFLRKDLNPFLDQLILDAGSRNPVIQKAPSEDLYLVFGPVMTFAFSKKTRAPYLEASVRGGIFRTTPAAIFVYDGTTGNNIYSVTASDKRYYPGLLATLGFFVPSKNNLWAWGVEAIGFRTKVDYIFPGATIYPFTRRHGGFAAGLAVRRNFEKDVPVPKPPTPGIVCEAPEIDLLMDGVSMKGYTYNLKKDTSRVDSIMLTWKSRNSPDTTVKESFTATIRQLNNGQDNIIAQTVCVDNNKLMWPAAYLGPNGRPVMGQYIVTVQSNLLSSCASSVCMAATGFAVKDSTIVPESCACFQGDVLEIYAYQRVKKRRIKYGKSPESCENCICPVDTVTTYQSVYHLLGTVKRDTCGTTNLNLREEVENGVRNGTITIPSWVTTLYVKKQTSVLGDKCTVPTGMTVNNYSFMVRNRKITSEVREVKQK